MQNWSCEIQELTNYYQSLSGKIADLEKELERLIKVDDEIGVLVSSRRCLEVIVTDICEKEAIKLGKTIPLKGIIDKLNKENKAPSHIITSMLNLNNISTYGAHPKEFDPRQVRTVLINLATIIEWYLNYKGIDTAEIPKTINNFHEELFVDAETKIPKKKSIIVLPFENMSPDPDQEYFSDGLTEEIITDLSHIHDLLVISRSSAMTFKGSRKKIKEIAHEVNVTHVLEGSVRKAGNNLRITAQLIDAENDTHLWAEKYNGTLDDVFDIQEKVSLAIASALKIKLSLAENKVITTHPITNIRAYEYYLKAREGIWHWREDSLDLAIHYLKNGIEEVGDNTVIFAGMSYVHWQYVNIGIQQEFHLNKAEEFVKKTFELDPESPHGHLVLGLLNIFRNIKIGINHLKLTLAYDPNNIDALSWLMFVYAHLGMPKLALNFLDRLKKIDPFNLFIQLTIGKLQIFDGDFKMALKTLHSLHQNNKENFPTGIWYALAHAYNGNYEDSSLLFADLTKGYPNLNFGSISFILGNALVGKKAEVIKSIDSNVEKMALRDPVLSYWISNSYALINEKSLALNWLETSINQGFVNFTFINKHDPFFENIRGEERFKKLMEKVKYEWENFEV